MADRAVLFDFRRFLAANRTERHPLARRIWLNPKLAKKPLLCLEYVVVPEMVPLVEPGHNERFRAIIDRAMPGWSLRAVAKASIWTLLYLDLVPIRWQPA